MEPYFSCRMRAMDAEKYADAQAEIAMALEKMRTALSSQNPNSIPEWTRQARLHLKQAVKSLESFEYGQFEAPKKD